MNKKSTKYILINSTFISEGISYDFDLYTPSSITKTQMQCFKESGIKVTSNEKEIIDSEKLFYVIEEEHNNYELLCSNTLRNDSEEIEDVMNFKDHSTEVYINASKALENLFHNPEALQNYEKSQVVVNEMVDVVLNDEYTVKSLMSIAAHDYYTHTHSINVAIYALSLGSFLGLDEKELKELGEAALLHDLGKSKIDPEIINKNGKLTDEEFEKIKQHSSYGYTLALKLGITNKNVLEGIRGHHEKMDGTGYPLRKKSEEIHYFARIIALCDIFDALTSKRSYKEAMTSFDAFLLIKTKMNKHVDLNLLKKMIGMFN